MADELPAQVKKQYEEVDAYTKAEEQEKAQAIRDRYPVGEAVTTQEEPPNYEQQYKTQQGMLKKEAEDHKATKQKLAEIESMYAESTARNQQLERMMEAPAVDEGQQGGVQGGNEQQALAELLGEDAVGYIRNLVKQETQEQISPIQQQFAQNSQNHGDALFFTQLQQQVPDYREIDADIGFRQWLTGVVPETGATRQDHLTYARDNQDAKQVANIFNLWKNNNTNGKSETLDTQADINSELNRQVSPAAGRAQPPAQGTPQETYTADQVLAFQTDVNKGLFRGNEDEQARIQAVFDRAAREGRIIG